MWMTWLRFRRQNAELAASTLQLLETTVRKLVYGTALIILIWCLITGYQVADFLIWRFWVVLASLVLVVHVSLYLVPKAILPAIMVWVGGLFLVNILVIVLLELPQAAFLLPAYPFFAVSAIGWPAGVMMVAVVGGATVALAQSPFGAFLAPYQIAIMVGGLLNGYVGWVVAATLIDEVRDTLFYYGQARDHMEEARTHRAKLMHVLKDLDRAYYSLERANGSLVAAWRKAEQAERFKAEFVTHLSHEMRTPLNLILGFSETILMSQESYAGIPLPGAYREDINKINRNAQHLMALINDVIDLSRADVNRIPLVREEVQVQTLVMDTVNMVSDYIHSKGLELKVTVDGTVQTIVVDVLRIRQVLLNLLVNAARFTDQGGIELQVTRQSEHISFKIIDSGRGINPKALPHIFEAYHSDTPKWHRGAEVPVSVCPSARR